MVSYPKKYNSAYPDDSFDELRYTADEISKIKHAVTGIIGKEPPTEFEYFLENSGHEYRSRLFHFQDRPNKSAIIASLGEAEQALQKVYDLFGGVEPIPADVEERMGTPKTQLYDSVIDEIQAALCDDTIFPIIAKAPVYQYFDKLQESTDVLTSAIRQAQKQLHAGKEISYYQPKLSEVRGKIVSDFAYGYEKYFHLKAAKYADGKFAKCLRILFDSLKCEFRGQKIVMPYPDNLYPILSQGIKKEKHSQEYQDVMYWEIWPEISPDSCIDFEIGS